MVSRCLGSSTISARPTAASSSRRSCLSAISSGSFLERKRVGQKGRDLERLGQFLSQPPRRQLTGAARGPRPFPELEVADRPAEGDCSLPAALAPLSQGSVARAVSRGVRIQEGSTADRAAQGSVQLQPEELLSSNRINSCQSNHSSDSPSSNRNSKQCRRCSSKAHLF